LQLIKQDIYRTSLNTPPYALARSLSEENMQPYHFSILGLALDIMGAFLVAVEAIKLENLRALRDRVLRRIHEYTLSPRIIFVDDAGHPLGRVQPPPVPADRYPGLFMGLHYVAGLILLVILNHVLDGWVYSSFIKGGLWVLDQPWYLAALLTLVFVIIGVVVGLWMLGELVHITLTVAMQVPIKIVDFIDARTPDGTVGIIGFLLLFAGFLLQMYGAYLGGRTSPSNDASQSVITSVVKHNSR
jgi:hypothetical protein